MSYAINGTSLILQPEQGQWNTRESYGIDGNGHSIYPAIRAFELQWSFMSTDEFKQVNDFYLSAITGTVVASLPKIGATPYAFFDYSGCVMNDPEVGAFFETYVSDVRLVISSIHV